MTEYIKLAVIFLLRVLFKIFYIFPIYENRILFISFHGKQYSCNPKYLFEYIYHNYGNRFQYVWCLNNGALFPEKYKNVIIVKYLSLKHIWYVSTSRYYIDNTVPFFFKRKEQIFINTWHGGGAYKKIRSGLNFLRRGRSKCKITLLEIRIKQISYIISSCSKFTDFMSREWDISENYFLPIGMPRNDMFFLNTDAKKKIKKQYLINEKEKIILFAPTFRGNPKAPDDINFFLDIDDLIKTVKKKFLNDFIFFFRGHFLITFNCVPDGLINVTDYPDMQELLCAADVLITDYSSSMWDFSLTFKPCFIYAPDLKKYQDEQGFYTPIEEWPFPLAETNEQLVENILNFDDEKYKNAVRKHHEALGSYENGTAAKRFCEKVFT